MTNKTIEEYKAQFIADGGGSLKQQERNEEIALLRFRDRKTMQEIADIYGITRQRVNAILKTF